MTPTELVTLLAPHVATLPPDCAVAVNECIGALLAHVTNKSAIAAAGDSKAKPDPLFAAKGQQYVARWRTKIENCLRGKELSRDELRSAVIESNGKCLPPAAFSQTLHAMWAKKIIERFEKQSADDEKVLVLWRLVLSNQDAETNQPQKEAVVPPKTIEKRIFKTRQNVTDWCWEFLGQHEQFRCESKMFLKALTEAGAPKILPDHYPSDGVGRNFGREKIHWLFIKDFGTWMMRAVDAEGNPIHRDSEGNVISAPNA